MTVENRSTGQEQASEESQRETLERIDNEMKDHEWDTRIIFQRHGRYDGGFPEAGWINPTDEEKDRLGHLTKEGAEEAREVASQRIREALKYRGENVDFLVVASPTRWLDHPELGQRAVETADVIKEEVKRQLDDAGLSPDQFLDMSPYVGPDSKDQYNKLVESQMFLDLDFTNELRKKYGGQNRAFWDAYNADANKERRLEVGAEGSPEAAERAHQFLDILARWAKLRKIEQPHRKTVIFVVSHHEVLEPFAIHKLGAQEREFEPQYNDGIEIDIDAEGIGRATIGSRAVEVSLGQENREVRH